MHRLIPAIGVVCLPYAISAAERSHFAAGLDELIELMTSILAFAVKRKTGRLPSFRIASSDRMTAIRAEAGASVALPEPLVFEDRFVQRMLTVWDGHTKRAPEHAATYLHVTHDEYIVGIASGDLVEAVANTDDAALRRELDAGTRIIGVWHGGG